MKKKILIIDDNENFQKAVKLNLELLDDDMEVLLASNGKDGLKMMQDHKPDAVLLDLIMPVMDGFTVLQTAKNDPGLMSIPIIILSAKDDEESHLKGAQLYSEYFVSKPVESAYLKDKIDEIISRHQATDS